MMTSRERVRRAIEFDRPDRLPFWQHEFADIPDDVCDIWEMDRQEAGWYFDTPAPDDWGCGWKATEVKNMGQVVDHPLADASALKSYTPPDPKNPFYYERLEPELQQAGERYTVVTSHFALIERLHMLRGFSQTMEDLYLNPEFVETVLDMILEFKVRQFEELHRRFGDAVHGVFMNDDWGTQQGTFIRPELFDRFFAPRYETLFGAIHDHGWHVMLHSCGR
ncbi:MAG: uroporphyrinogen decarboxylase family protein, partial [Armatimonadota bacterium]